MPRWGWNIFTTQRFTIVSLMSPHLLSLSHSPILVSSAAKLSPMPLPKWARVKDWPKKQRAWLHLIEYRVPCWADSEMATQLLLLSRREEIGSRRKRDTDMKEGEWKKASYDGGDVKPHVLLVEINFPFELGCKHITTVATPDSYFVVTPHMSPWGPVACCCSILRYNMEGKSRRGCDSPGAWKTHMTKWRF